MSISDVINIVLAILSFALATISVVTVIITLKQNGKMIKNTKEQIEEMRNEYKMSLQPVLCFSNAKFGIERPRLFYTPPVNEYSVLSRFYFSVEIENISTAVAININCNAYILPDRNEDDSVETTVTKRIKVLSGDKVSVEFMFTGDLQETILDRLREMNSFKRPQIFVSVVYSNTTGGRFYIENGYHISADEMDIIKRWHTIVSGAEVKYKEELKEIREGGNNSKIFEKTKRLVRNASGEDEYVELDCIDMIDCFRYETISEEEYQRRVSGCKYPVYIGKGVTRCYSQMVEGENEKE